ncbi:UV-endonuclease UvdE-domain-containing protein [Sparassis latifolia]|uniref:UV-damage endonuclease n=1 Tax=Sparassis crispa TaxID=139825 RepID=A0A401H5Q8_9APHY|nr:UV-damage endonuclease [Sparassis crispa]GBE89775.1 UV-damage endonuclease [Sparassis crispa]
MAKRKHIIAPRSIPDIEVPVDAVTQSETVVLRRSARVKKSVTYTEVTLTADAEANEVGVESPLTDLEEAEESPTKKRMRRGKNEEPVVYDIPPVVQKETAFKGRLGYACLNTILRALKPNPVFCSRTCRMETIRKNGLQYAKDLGLQNSRDLIKIIQWNEDNNIRFFRVSSEMFPFASHSIHGYSLEYAAKELKAAGDLAKRFGHRLTAHPGQFTQLASPHENVITASVRELDYHCQMLRYMELDKDSVIILHMGGVYGDKPATLERFRETFRTRLTQEMRDRIVLENDEMCYSADELLPVCRELEIPLVFDYHHNWINPSTHPLAELLPQILATWAPRGIRPKQHLSEPRPGAQTVMEKRAHADRCAGLPLDLPVDMDLMIEAKDKEQAVLHLYRIYSLASVIHENLRPEKPPKPFVRRGDSSANVDPNADSDVALGIDAEPEVTAGVDAEPGTVTVDEPPLMEGAANADASTVLPVLRKRKRAANSRVVALEALETDSSEMAEVVGLHVN